MSNLNICFYDNAGVIEDLVKIAEELNLNFKVKDLSGKNVKLFFITDISDKVEKWVKNVFKVDNKTIIDNCDKEKFKSELYKRRIEEMKSDYIRFEYLL